MSEEGRKAYKELANSHKEDGNVDRQTSIIIFGLEDPFNFVSYLWFM